MRKPAGESDHARALGRIAEQDLQELRDEHGGAEEHDAEDELQEDGGAEVAVLEQLEVDDGVGVVPLPEDEEDERNGDDEESGNHRIAKPVFLLAFVEDELEAADPDGHEAEADKVDLGLLL